MLYSQNDGKKAGEVEKISTYRRNLANFLSEIRFSVKFTNGAWSMEIRYNIQFVINRTM
jgi:hypothetical protein